MREEDVLREAMEIDKELQGSQEEKKRGRGPMFFIIGLFMILIMITMAVPYYSVRHDPAPHKIAQYSEIFPEAVSLSEIPEQSSSFIEYVQPNDPVIKRAATRIATISCQEGVVCHAKAIYGFVKANFYYVSETDEYIQHPKEVIYTKGGDCEDLSLLLANLMMADGIPARLVFVPKHVYVQVYIPDALNKYKDDEGWISVDPACSTCAFGQDPPGYEQYEKRYLPLY